MAAHKAIFNWSGGKDSALALQCALENEQLEIIGLLTTLSKETLQSSIHAIPLSILQLQANAIGIPLYTALFSEDLSDYQSAMNKAVTKFQKMGVTHFIYGDISTTNIQEHREQHLNSLGINLVEPLGHKTSQEVIELFLQTDLRAKIIVTQADKLGKEYIGQDISKALLASFPSEIDPCGEQGEYHSIAYSGSLFGQEIPVNITSIEHVSYDITLDNGHTQTYKYWRANLQE
ncbi:MAG: ATP-binding protein [Weeksellaceae bacterium]|nr:ATP-binding protein [Weeksellaceae bacterium]